jgi:hypothetical protein
MKIRRNGSRVLPPFHLGPLHQLSHQAPRRHWVLLSKAVFTFLRAPFSPFCSHFVLRHTNTKVLDAFKAVPLPRPGGAPSP